MHYCGVVADAGLAPARDAGGGAHAGAADPAQRALLRAGRRPRRWRASCTRSTRWWSASARRWPARATAARGATATRCCCAAAWRRRRRRQETRAAGRPAARPAGVRARDGDEHTGAGRRGRLQPLPAVRDQRRRRVLRAPGPAAARQAPPVRPADAHRGAGRRPRDRRRRRPLAPPHRGDRRDRLRALRAPLRGRPRQLARATPRRASWCCPAPRSPSEFTRQGVMPPVERLHLSRA